VDRTGTALSPDRGGRCCDAAVDSLEDAMKRLVELVVTAAMLTSPAAASAQTLTEAQARAAIAPWYQLFNQPVQGDMKTLQEQTLTADYESCWGYLPGDCWGLRHRSRLSEALPSRSRT
jgi:hypothetical protein